MAKSKRKVAEALSTYARQEAQRLAGIEEHHEPHVFSSGYHGRKEKILQTGKRKQQRHVITAAAVMTLFLTFSVVVSANFDFFYAIVIEAMDQFFSISSDGSDIGVSKVSSDLLVTEVPERFTLKTMNILQNVKHYVYESEDGDTLDVTEETGKQETWIDAETEYEVLQMEGREIYMGYKANQNAYCVFFRFDPTTTVTLVGSITREEVIEILEKTLQK